MQRASVNEWPSCAGNDSRELSEAGKAVQVDRSPGREARAHAKADVLSGILLLRNHYYVSSSAQYLPTRSRSRP